MARLLSEAAINRLQDRVSGYSSAEFERRMEGADLAAKILAELWWEHRSIWEVVSKVAECKTNTNALIARLRGEVVK